MKISNEAFIKKLRDKVGTHRVLHKSENNILIDKLDEAVATLDSCLESKTRYGIECHATNLAVVAMRIATEIGDDR